MSNRLLSVLLCLLSSPVFAQCLTAFELSNYAGTNGLYLNPSSIADSRWRMHINLATASFQANTQPRVPLATVPFSQADLKRNGQELAVNQADLRGPGVMVQLGGNQALAVTTRYRANLNLTGGYDLIRWIQGDKTPLFLLDRSVQLNSNAFTEVALSYAASVLDRKGHFLKVGGTYKYLRGLQTATLSASGQFGAPASQLRYTLTDLQTTYSDLSTLSGLTISDALFGDVPGAGVGFDLGLTYEFRPEAESFRYSMDGQTRSDGALTKYRFRLGVSLLDMGSIRYKNASAWLVQPRASTLLQTDVQLPKTPTQVRDAVAQSLGVAPDGISGDLVQKLPQTLSVQLDAQLKPDLFFGAVWWKPTGAAAANPALGQHRADLISIGPRYERPIGEMSLTGNYWPGLGKFSVGTHIRLGVLTVGSDNILGFFSDNGLATHLFAGVTLPFNVRRPADRDRDAVSDERDRCPDVPGVWAFQGCPDTDGDGIQDENDSCPQVAGPVATKGCPDTDKDGILDKDDACPTQAGLAHFNGCPDTDSDGIADKADECPTVAGLSALRGCPDADADGIRDSQDACPTEAGLKELNGCTLKGLVRTGMRLSASEKVLFDRLGRSWSGGPNQDTQLLATLKTYLNTHPGRLLTLEFSGASREQLERVANWFEDELDAYFGNTQRFQFTINGQEIGPASVKLGLRTEK